MLKTPDPFYPICIHDQATGEVSFTTFETTRSELRRLLDKEQPAVVIIEACLLAGWVRDLCLDLGVVCVVANTASEAWKFKHLKRPCGRSPLKLTMDCKCQ